MESAELFLTHLNYYRLSAYWHPYQKNDGNFKENTRFNKIVNHYLFDKELRILLLEVIESFEVSLRANWAYILSISNQDSHAYLDINIFDRKKRSEYHKTINDIKKIYTKSKEVFIEHYKKKYREPELSPIWTVCEIFSFGNLVSLYSCLTFQYQKMICKKYGIYDAEVFLSFIRNINAVRNICAHHGRIWNRSLRTCKIKHPKKLEDLRSKLNQTNDTNIYNTIVFLCFIDKIISLKSTWIEKFKTFIKKSLAEKIITNDDLISMGFPDDLSRFSVLLK